MIPALKLLRRQFCFCLSNVLFPVKDLPLQIADIHPVKISNPDRTDSCCCQIEADGRSKSPRPDYQHPAFRQLFLSFFSYLRQENISFIAFFVYLQTSVSFLNQPPPSK